MAKKHFIYKITNTVNGKIYIGKTSNIDSRWRYHKYAYPTKNTHLYRSMRKYGFDKFRIDVIEKVTESRVNEIEQYWIAKLKTTDSSIGYNIHHGGTGGNSFANKSEEQIRTYCKKISDAQKARIKAGTLDMSKVYAFNTGIRNNEWNGYWCIKYPDGTVQQFVTRTEMMKATGISTRVFRDHSIMKTTPRRGKFAGCRFFKSKRKLK